MSRVFNALQEAQRRAGRGPKPVWEDIDTRASDLGKRAQRERVGEAGLLTLTSREEDRLVSLTDSKSVGGESFRLLASRLDYLRKGRTLRSLLVTSSVVNEGKSLISANLAIALSDHGDQKTLLIDSDHRHATLTQLFRCHGKPGLREWLGEGGPVERFALRCSDRPLWFVPAGTRGPAVERTVQSERIAEMIASTDAYFDWIVVDSSPVTVLADTTVWSSVLDGYLLVTREGVTPRKMLQKAINSLDPDKMLGLLLNECADPSHAYHSSYYQPTQS